MKNIFVVASILLVFAYSCTDKTNDDIDFHNRSLINIPISDLKTILSGNWVLVKERICGFAPCYDTTYPVGQRDQFSFLSQDTVKRIRYDGAVFLYEKAVITRSSFDNTWLYTMSGGLRNWSFQKIKNDTLFASIDYSQGSVSYLVKKP